MILYLRDFDHLNLLTQLTIVMGQLGQNSQENEKMRTATEFAVIAGVIGIIALVGVASAAAATGYISGAHGVSSSSNTGEGMMTDGNMSGGMNERCGMGQDMQGMMRWSRPYVHHEGKWPAMPE